MIITLKGADFSTNKIGTLSNWTVTPVIDSGTTYSGTRSIEKTNPVFSATLTLVDGYAYSDGITVTMSGGGTVSQSTSGNVTTLSCSNVTGNITIKALTYNTSTGESGGGSTGGDLYTLTINVTPSDANLIVYNGTTTSDPVLHQGTGSTTLSNIATNTTVRAVASKSGYYTQGKTVTVTENTTLNLELDAIDVPEGTTNIISQGTLHEKKALSSSSYSMTANESYFVYDQIPVEAGATYQVSSGLRTWWLKSDKSKISTINFSATDFIATAPANAAYVSVTYPYSAVTPDTAWIVKTS